MFKELKENQIKSRKRTKEKTQEIFKKKKNLKKNKKILELKGIITNKNSRVFKADLNRKMKKINKLEDRTKEIVSEEQKTERPKTKEQSLRTLWNTIRKANIHYRNLRRD